MSDLDRLEEELFERLLAIKKKEDEQRQQAARYGAARERTKFGWDSACDPVGSPG